VCKDARANLKHFRRNLDAGEDDLRRGALRQIGLGCHVPVSLPAILGRTNEASDFSAAKTPVDRQIVSSFTIRASLLRVMLRTLARVRRFADAKKTAFGPIGNTIKHDALFNGIPHGYCIRGAVNNGRSPIRITF